MPQSKSPASSHLIRILLVILGLSAVAYGIWKIVHRAARPPMPRTEQERVSEVVAHDRAILSQERSADAEIFSALVRLGQLHDATGRQEAIRRASSSTTLIREGAANALGHFDDAESMEVLKKLLADAAEPVRVQAVAALGHRPGGERESLLKGVLARAGATPRERQAAQASLTRIASSDLTRGRMVQELVDSARRASDAELSRRALTDAVSLAPRDPRVLALLREIVAKPRDGASASLAIRHLAFLHDPALAPKLTALFGHADAQVRAAAVQTLHLTCPATRWTLLEGMLRKEKDAGVLTTAIAEVPLMPGPDARALLARVRDTPGLAPGLKDQLTAALGALSQGNGIDPCLGAR